MMAVTSHWHWFLVVAFALTVANPGVSGLGEQVHHPSSLPCVPHVWMSALHHHLTASPKYGCCRVVSTEFFQLLHGCHSAR